MGRLQAISLGLDRSACSHFEEAVCPLTCTVHELDDSSRLHVKPFEKPQHSQLAGDWVRLGMEMWIIHQRAVRNRAIEQRSNTLVTLNCVCWTRCRWSRREMRSRRC